jgi:hypothetical protein
MNYKEIKNIILLLINESVTNYDLILNKYIISLQMKEIIKEDLLFVDKIIDFNYQDTIIKINQNLTLLEIINYINFDFIKFSTNPIKIKFIKFNKIIIKWLYDINFFEITYNEFHKNNFKLKNNQLTTFNKLNINGLETGIHCQSIGCGKSYIIIKYIDYMIKNYTNPKIILFTKNINIISDLINKSLKDIKIKEFKENGLCDFSNIEIINRLTVNKKDWIFKLIKSYKPLLLMINKLYIINPEIYKKINNYNLNLILYDECTNIINDKTYNFLLYCKSINIPIIGFSSMPLRIDEFKIPKLFDIFNNKNNNIELNLLTNYNLIYSLNYNYILPFNFYLYQIKCYNNISKNSISKKELNNVFNILNEIMPFLSYKKIIAWCDNIKNAIKWKSLFEKYFKTIYNFNFGIDIINNINNYDYDKFKNNNNMILFCVSKYRNNFNINNIDCCIFLDNLYNRSTDIFINTINKIIKNNKCIIIDKYINDNNDLINKVLNYYLILLNISLLDTNKYNIYIDFINSININNQDKIIILNIENINININYNTISICEDIELNYEIIYNFLQNKLNILKNNIFNVIINKIKTIKIFNDLLLNKKINEEFWIEYNNLNHKLLCIPIHFKDEFKEYFDNILF